MFQMHPMYQCLIIDDHLIERDLLSAYVAKVSSLQLVATCSNGVEALAILQNNTIDIVFSDIDMPELSGIDLVKSLKHPPVFLFISSYPEYAAEGYNLDIIDFVVKPITFSRFIKAVNKAIDYIELKNTHPKNTTADLQLADAFFLIKDQKGITKVAIQNVLYIESMGDFSKIHLKDQTSLLMLVGLKNAEIQLKDKQFIRVHKQYLVNTLHIEQILGNDIVLSNHTTIPLSNAYKPILEAAFIQQSLLKRF